MRKAHERSDDEVAAGHIACSSSAAVGGVLVDCYDATTQPIVYSNVVLRGSQCGVRVALVVDSAIYALALLFLGPCWVRRQGRNRR